MFFAAFLTSFEAERPQPERSNVVELHKQEQVASSSQGTEQRKAA